MTELHRCLLRGSLRLGGVLTAFGMVLGAAGCGDNEFQPPPPPIVTVETPEVRSVTEYTTFTGTVSAKVAVDVHARVSGVLQEVRYDSGDVVSVGDPLFLIDPEPFVAARDAAEARVRAAEAERDLAEATADRVERSARDGALSRVQALQARAEAEAAAAAVLVAQKELEIRQLDVDYTEIASPVAGIAERSPFDVGDLVGGGTSDASRLTTIVDDARVNVSFFVADRVFLRSIRREPESDGGEAEPVFVEIGTEIDDGFPFVGEIDYADPTVDEATGTILIRATVENPDRRLVGGLFVRVRLAVREMADAVLVPRAAVAADQAGSYVLVVDGAGVVSRRGVELGPVDGADQVVLSGVSAEDRVITEGLLMARPGSTVNAQPPRAAAGVGLPEAAPQTETGGDAERAGA